MLWGEVCLGAVGGTGGRTAFGGLTSGFNFD